jgi:hypothetical protein
VWGQVSWCRLNTEVLTSPLPDLLPDVFFDGENISFDANLVIYIYVYIYIYI